MKRLASFALALVGACGGGGDPSGAPDAAGLPGVADAQTAPPADGAPPAPDAATTECPPGLPDSFGNLGAVTANKNTTPYNPSPEDPIQHHNVFVDLDDNARWFFAMNLYPGRGIFADGVKPGRYELMGADTDYQYCAACLSLFADWDQTEGGPSLHMFAAKGTLQIDSVNADGHVSGSLKDVLLTAIDIAYDDEGVACSPNDDGTVSDVPECVNTICLSGHCGRQVNLVGCDTSIDAMSF